MTDGSYGPTESLTITSVNEMVVSIANDDVNNPVKDIISDNVAIQHGAWNINRTEVAEAASAAFLTSVALAIANATSILISNIEISHTGSYGLRIMDGTSYITMINSLITDTGTIINGNVIKNVFSYIIYMWGIYLDNASSNIIVSNNVVYNTGWSSIFHHYGANNTIVNNVFARASLFPPPYHDYGAPDGDVSIAVAENHLSWIYTRNIPNVTALFNNNVFFNAYGTPLLFGYNQTSFSEWQKTGQDNNSVIADPLFAGDVNQCDFFTVQSNSPAAKLRFVNLTKLLQWTPGCSTDDEINSNQFYHW